MEEGDDDGLDGGCGVNVGHESKAVSHDVRSQQVAVPTLSAYELIPTTFPTV